MANKSIAIPAQGTTWEVEDPALADTWVKIGGVKTFNRNEAAATVNDETNLDSTYKEKSIGLPDAGQTTLNVQYNRTDAGQKILQDAKKTGDLVTVRGTMTDGSTETNSCYVLTAPYDGSANGGGLNGTFTLENTGEPIWTEPTP